MKLFKKLAIAAVGAVMALGVGIGVAVNQGGIPVKADGDVEITLSDANGFTQDGVTIAYNKNGGTQCAWYTAGLRLYPKNQITISCASDITGVTFNWEKQGTKPFNTVTANVGSYSHPSSAGQGLWSGSAKSITFTCANTSGAQLQLNTFTVSVGGSGPVVIPEPDVLSKTIAEINAICPTATKAQAYSVTGVVSNIVDEGYGNFTLTDSTGSIYVYGASKDASKLSFSGATGLYSWSSSKTNFTGSDVDEGDTITMKCIALCYNSTNEIQGVITNVQKPVVPPTPVDEITLELGDKNSSECTVNEIYAIKMGKSGDGGNMLIKVPAHTTSFVIGAAAWKDKTVSLSLVGAITTSIDLDSDTGISNNTPFTLAGSEANYHHTITLEDSENSTTISIDSGKERAVVWLPLTLSGDGEAWCSLFLETVVCDNGAHAPTGWADNADFWSELSSSDKAIIKNSSANESGTLPEQVIARYDYIINKYGTSSYSDFMGRMSNSSNRTNVVESSSSLVIMVASLVGVSTIAGYFLLRKKKETF